MRRLLPRVLRARLSRHGQDAAAARRRVPRARVVERSRRRRRDARIRRRARHRARHRTRACSISALVIDRDGERLGFQDKVQLDPSEDGRLRRRGAEPARVHRSAPLTFGVAICHEGWRYPETVRWAARRGAQVVFHPHFHEAEPGSYRPVDLRRSGEHVPREGRAVPRRREHLLLRDRELRERRLADHVRRSRGPTARCSRAAVRRGRPPRRRPRPRRSHGPARVAVPGAELESEQRNSGTAGAEEQRNSRVKEPRSSGTAEQRNSGAVELRSSGTAAQGAAVQERRRPRLALRFCA